MSSTKFLLLLRSPRRSKPCRNATGVLLPALLLAGAVTWTSCGPTTPEDPSEDEAHGVDLTPPLPPEFESLDPRASLTLEELYMAVVAAPRDVGLRFRYAALLDAIEFEDAAQIAWMQVAALDLTDARSRHHLGRLRADAGHLEGAVEALQGALQLEPGYAPTHWRLGLALLDRGHLDEARTAFEEARRLAPRDPSGATGLARVALQENDLATAGTLLEAELEAHPDDGYLPKLLARVRRQQGDEAAATALLARPDGPTSCFRGDPWVRELSEYRVGFKADLSRARELLAAGRANEALVLLEPLYAEDPAHLAVESLIVRSLLALQQTERAQTILRESIARGDHPRTQVSLGFVNFVREEYAAALDCADRAIEVQPALANAHFLRAKALAALLRREEAVDALENAFARGEEGLDARLLFGQTLAELGELERAVAAFRAATEAFPASVQAWAMRCEVEVHSGLEVDARRSLAEVAARDAEGLFVPVLRSLLEDMETRRGTPQPFEDADNAGEGVDDPGS